jgi:LacI family transcriptional regulator
MSIDRADSGRRGVVTLDDVARRVGVSARTVSRVVNDQGGCTPATRERILAAIDELGYRPNLLARGLLTNRSDTIGLVGAEMADPFFTELADGVQRAARELRRTMFFASTDRDAVRQAQVLSSLYGHGVDGVIVFPAAGSEADILATAANGLPVVLVDRELSGHNIAVVNNDLRAGGLLATEHLIRSGRRRIAMATDENTLHDQAGERRQAGYRDALGSAGMAERLVSGANTVDGGRACARQLLASGDRPDAVFVFNDLMALGVLQELGRSGITVPGDIAVVGFDDIAMCDAVAPRLTTVRIDRDRLGRVAVEQLQSLRDRPGGADPVCLDVELVVRESG